MKRGPRRKRELVHEGQTMHVSALSIRTGIPIDVLWQRWETGDRGDALVRKVGAAAKQLAPDVRKILPPDPRFDALVAAWNRAVFP